ncbi:MAG: CocE/NonD family hydrolase [Lentisphaeria bacterium]|nr:CocE/NonD family hydrolase [Lentisphaeria bacterium]
MSKGKDQYNVSTVQEADNISCSIRSIMLPCRDGVRLHTVIYFPVNMPEKAPVILRRSPYCHKNIIEPPDGWALKNGVVSIMQSCRGTAWSEGVFDPAERDSEKKDVEDLFLWLRKQDWFNGRCVMAGASYPGWLQWCAARSGFPELVGTAPRVAPLYSCTGSVLPGGGVRLSFSLSWMLTMHYRCHFGWNDIPNLEEKGLFRHLPVIEADRQSGYGRLAPFRKFMEKAEQPGRHLGIVAGDFKSCRVPAYIVGGWFDLFKTETVESFRLMQAHAKTANARKFTRLTVGPWGHGGLLNPDLFGEHCNYADTGVEDRTLSHLGGLLKDPDRDPLPDEPKVRYYSLGENQWHTADCWPPEKVRETVWFLHSGGNANSLTGDGRLTARKPGREQPDVYVSNPDDPVLSNNGGHALLGCYDRTPQQKRSDVLIYNSLVFRRPLAVAGAVRLRFTASASTPDTDFVATLTDVLPDGRAMFLTTGMIRARFRNSLDREELLETGKPYEFEIDLSHIAVTFLPGHAMRLEICGQHFPQFDRNANTGGRLLHDTRLEKSVHTIFHDEAHPAELILPVLDPEPPSAGFSDKKSKKIVK